MIDNIKVFTQSSIKIEKSLKVYFDPFKIDLEYHDADYIFITHNHYDHYDVKSINKIMKNDSVIIVPKSIYDEVLKDFENVKILPVNPEEEYDIGIKFKTVRAYNINKPYHPKDNNWLGYVVTIDNITYYAMGDTDDIPEARDVLCDVLFVPIGGTYTMDKKEAVIFTNYVKPKVVIPIHYGSIVGTMDDGEYFASNVDKEIQTFILIK